MSSVDYAAACAYNYFTVHRIHNRRAPDSRSINSIGEVAKNDTRSSIDVYWCNAGDRFHADQLLSRLATFILGTVLCVCVCVSDANVSSD